MNVAYLIFTEGYAATSGDDWLRPELCQDALRLARLLTALAPDEPETHGLLALLELQSSRGAARTDDTGGLVLLEQQDRSRWDQLAIRRGCEALGRALAAGPPGPYALQAAVAACHARAGSVAGTDWTSIAGLYDALARLTDSPVVLVNRAVAHGMSAGPAVGLRLVDELADAPGLRDSHLLPSVRGDLLDRLGHTDCCTPGVRAGRRPGRQRPRAGLPAGPRPERPPRARTSRARPRPVTRRSARARLWMWRSAAGAPHS
jgi:predicted RNA polymerase sigma factor